MTEIFQFEPAFFDQDFVEHMTRQGVGLLPLGGYHVHPETWFEPPISLSHFEIWTLPATIGAFSYFGTGVFHNAQIGRYCSVADGLKLGVGRHPTDFLTSSPVTYKNFLGFEQHFIDRQPDWQRTLPNSGPLEIWPRNRVGNDVWIGTNVFIKDGTAIGDGAIIGAHAVVTHDVAPYQIMGGNPARVIRHRFPDRTVEKLLKLQWWRYNIYELSGVDARDIDSSIDSISELIDRGTVQPYEPLKINLLQEYKIFITKRSAEE